MGLFPSATDSNTDSNSVSDSDSDSDFEHHHQKGKYTYVIWCFQPGGIVSHYGNDARDFAFSMQVQHKSSEMNVVNAMLYCIAVLLSKHFIYDDGNVYSSISKLYNKTN